MEKVRNLIQTYDKLKSQETSQGNHKKGRLHNDSGPTIGRSFGVPAGVVQPVNGNRTFLVNEVANNNF